MTEQEKKKRAAARRRKRQRERRRRIAIGISLALICIIGILLFLFAGKLVKKKNGAGNTDLQSRPAEGSVSTLSGAESTVSTAAVEPETITLTDADLHTGDLILVNSTYGYDFGANAARENLVNIKENQSYSYQVEKPEYQLSADVLPWLDAMISACDAAMGTSETGITSAYRTVDYQQNLWNETVTNYGEDYARKYVAVPGCSEHHTGKTCDIGIFYADGSQGSFSESRNAVWMRENCGQFGFIRRYAEDKTEITGISNEAWHFRYVGFPHAGYMMGQNLCLEEYLDYLRNNTSAASPLTVTDHTGSYKVYYTAERTITKPSGSYAISGDNMGGFIITEMI
ncbi:MAG: M15 family metallopeptidase [Lachnospiraceae bacterium]|nr:M15 family metallopeptidase [Lachnospiraceae bacterium]